MERVLIGDLSVDGLVRVDNISEYTTDAGVTIEGALVKDDSIFLTNAGGLDQYGWNILIGANYPAFTTRTDDTAKIGVVTVPHYDNAEEPVFVIAGSAGETSNEIQIGSGAGFNAATRVVIAVASDTTTVGGSAVADFTPSGFRVDTIGELNTDAGVTINDEVYMPTIGGSGTGTSMIYYNRSTGELTYGDAYVHPNHTGQIDSVGDGATSANSTLVSAQTNMTNVAAADEFLMLNDDLSALGRATVSELQTYMQANLTFGGIGYGADTQIPYMNGTSAFQYSGNLTFSGTELSVNGDIRLDTAGSSRLLLGTGATNYIYQVGLGHITIIRNSNIAVQLTTSALLLGSGFDVIGMGTTKTQDIGSSSVFFDNAYFDRVYVDDTAVYIDITGSGATLDMTFTSTLAGTVSLNDLTGSATVNYGTDTQVPYMNGTTAFQYSDNLTFTGSLLTTVGTIRAQNTVASPTSYVTMTSSQFNMFISSTQRVLFYPDVADGASAVAFTMGTDNNLTTAGAKLFQLQNQTVEKFFVDKDGNVDIVTGAEYRINGVPIGGTNYWTRTGTDLTPINSGDDILLATTTERIVFGDTDTWIYESADDEISVVVGSTTQLKIGETFTTSTNHFIPVADKTYDLGSSSSGYWQDLYIERIFIANTDTIIARDGSGNMTFVDGVTSIKTLAELAAAGTGDVSWGTETGLQPIVFGATAGDIDSDSALSWNATTNTLVVNGDTTIIGSVVNFTGLGSDDTELYLMAINNSTGLLTKRSVASLSSGDWTFGSGIQESSGEISLGGLLIEDLVFAGGNYEVDFGTGASKVDDFRIYSSNDIFFYAGGGTPSQARILMDGSLSVPTLPSIVVEVSDASSDIKGFSISAASFTITDEQDSRGMVYAADYSSGAGNRWITDKEYVDGVSDKRLKENIVLVTDSVLPGLKTLDTYTFNLKKDPNKIRRYGLIYQDVVKVFPEVTHEMDGGFFSVRYKELVAITIKGINEVVATQESQEQKIKRLTKRVSTLEKELGITAN